MANPAGGNPDAGTLDISDALIFYGLRGTPPKLLLCVIASALLGPAAFTNAVPGALIGLAIHFFITLSWAVLFILAANRAEALKSHAIVSGILYGLVIYVIMNFVVLPHTRGFRHPTFHLIIFLNAVLALVLFQGLPISILNRRMT
jgi:hypothetical protein